jgi:hypothetical protein
MKLIDLKTLAKDVSLSVSTLRKYRGQGMPHYNVGRKILVNPEEFQAWMEARFKVTGTVASSDVDHVVADVLHGMGFDRT